MKTMTPEEQKDACNRLLEDIETQTRVIEEKPVQALEDYDRMDLFRDMRIIIRLLMEKHFEYSQITAYVLYCSTEMNTKEAADDAK